MLAILSGSMLWNTKETGVVVAVGVTAGALVAVGSVVGVVVATDLLIGAVAIGVVVAVGSVIGVGVGSVGVVESDSVVNVLSGVSIVLPASSLETMR